MRRIMIILPIFLLFTFNLVATEEEKTLKEEIPITEKRSGDQLRITGAALKLIKACKERNSKELLKLLRSNPVIDILFEALELAENPDYSFASEADRKRVIDILLQYSEHEDIVCEQTLANKNNKIGWWQNIKSNKGLFGLIGAGALSLGLVAGLSLVQPLTSEHILAVLQDRRVRDALRLDSTGD